MSQKHISRRQFLQSSVLGAGAMALSSCTTLDGLFMGDSHDLTQEVVILGAGAAGLAAAFELKKRKIPFRIFEASSRIGGRVQTVNFASDGSLTAELGAEFIERDHVNVFNLAKELNLSLVEVKAGARLEPQVFNYGGRNYFIKDLAAHLKTLQAPLQRVRADLFRNQDVMLSVQNANQYERSVYYDSLSLKDLLLSWNQEVHPLVLNVLESQAMSRFGVDAKEQSALQFLSTIDAEGTSLLSGRPIYRMNSGLSELTQTLAARVEGVIPDRILKTNSPLIEIREDRGVFYLKFQTAGRNEVYKAKNIICTLPFSKLREVKGWDDLEISATKKQCIRSLAYAPQTKGALSFKNKFWLERKNIPANLGNFTGDFLSQKFWESGRQQSSEVGLMSFLRSGQSGLLAGANAPQEALNDLKLFYLPLASYENVQFINWSTRKWAKGSMAYYKPSQYMKLKGIAAETEYDGYLQFAGEHTSLRYAGTLEGAISSGLRAARQVKV